MLNESRKPSPAALSAALWKQTLKEVSKRKQKFQKTLSISLKKQRKNKTRVLNVIQKGNPKIYFHSKNFFTRAKFQLAQKKNTVLKRTKNFRQNFGLFRCSRNSMFWAKKYMIKYKKHKKYKIKNLRRKKQQNSQNLNESSYRIETKMTVRLSKKSSEALTVNPGLSKLNLRFSSKPTKHSSNAADDEQSLSNRNFIRDTLDHEQKIGTIGDVIGGLNENLTLAKNKRLLPYILQKRTSPEILSEALSALSRYTKACSFKASGGNLATLKDKNIQKERKYPLRPPMSTISRLKLSLPTSLSETLPVSTASLSAASALMQQPFFYRYEPLKSLSQRVFQENKFYQHVKRLNPLLQVLQADLFSTSVVKDHLQKNIKRAVVHYFKDKIELNQVHKSAQTLTTFRERRLHDQARVSQLINQFVEMPIKFPKNVKEDYKMDFFLKWVLKELFLREKKAYRFEMVWIFFFHIYTFLNHLKRRPKRLTQKKLSLVKTKALDHLETNIQAHTKLNCIIIPNQQQNGLLHSQTIANYISRFLERKLNKENVLKFFKKDIDIKKLNPGILDSLAQCINDIQKQAKKSARGIRISCSGRINGVEKKTVLCKKLGPTSLNTFNSEIDYATQEAFTKFGVLNVKVWLTKK